MPAREVSGADIRAPAKRGYKSGWNDEAKGVCTRQPLGFRRRWRRQRARSDTADGRLTLSRYRAGLCFPGFRGFREGASLLRRPIRRQNGALQCPHWRTGRAPALARRWGCGLQGGKGWALMSVSVVSSSSWRGRFPEGSSSPGWCRRCPVAARLRGPGRPPTGGARRTGIRRARRFR